MLKYIYLNIEVKLMFSTTDTCKIIEYSSDTKGRVKKHKNARHVAGYIANTEKYHLCLHLLSSYWFRSAASWCAQL